MQLRFALLTDVSQLLFKSFHFLSPNTYQRFPKTLESNGDQYLKSLALKRNKSVFFLLNMFLLCCAVRLWLKLKQTVV